MKVVERSPAGIASSLALPLLLLASMCVDAVQLSQTPRFRRLDVAEGLPSSTVFQVAQDRDGYLWIASGDGLARFDGVAFRIWRHDPRDARSLPGNVVQALHVDRDDRVWVAAEGAGLAVLDRDRGGFRRIAATAGEDIWAIASDVDGALWFGGFGGGLRRLVDEQAGREAIQAWTHDDDDPGSLAGDVVLALAADPGGGVWAATVGGVDHVGDAGVEHLPGLPAGVALSLHLDRAGELWIGTHRGLHRRSPSGRLERVGRDAEFGHGVTAVHRDRRGGVWIGTRRGLLRQREGVSDDVSAAFAPYTGAAPAMVLGIFEDHEQGLWFATRGAGLGRLTPTWRNFAVIPSRTDASAPAALVAAAEDADGSIWVTGDAGLARFAAGAAAPTWVATEDVFASRRQRGLLATPEAIWIGHQGGLSRFNRRTGTIRHYPSGSGTDATPGGAIDLLAHDGAGGLWLSAYGAGIQRRDSDGRVRLDIRAGDGRGLESFDTEQLATDGEGMLWLAGAQGLLRWDARDQRFVRPAGLPNVRVHAFAFGDAGAVWVQSIGALRRYARDGGGFRLDHDASLDDGIPAIAAGGLAVDASGELWMTTSRGLYHYRPRTRALRAYGVRDGLPTPEFHDRPLLRTRDGRIVASTAAGTVLFDPARLERVAAEPRLVLEGVRVRRAGEVVTLPVPLPDLAYDDRDLEVESRLLSFADPLGHRYRSQLLGVDADWIDHGADGIRRIGRLDPGGYRLRVVAANADGVWSPRPLSLELRVLPPWWRTPLAWSAWIALAVAVLLAAALGYRRRLARLHARDIGERQRAWALRALEARTAFLATMGHEIRTPMTGVLGMTELLLDTPLTPRQQGYADAIRQSGELMLRVVNDALDLARIEAGRLELVDAPLDPAALLQDVANLCAPLAERRGLELRCRIDDSAPRAVRGDALRIRQILLNLAGNALKFTGEGRIELALEPAAPPDTLCCSVTDTGPGLSMDQQARLFQRFRQADGDTTQRHGGSGLGLAICSELAQLMGGRITLHSEPGQGSRFAVLLPLQLADAPSGGTTAAGDVVAGAERDGSAAASVDAAAIVATTHAIDDAARDDAAAVPDADAQCDPAPHAPAGGARRVLLVEDDATIATVLSELLRRRGHRVRHAEHGLAALSAWQSEPFDLVLVDLDLPGVDGLTLARMLRGQGACLPLVAITARADQGAEAEALEAGMSGFLRKPIPPEALFAAVETASTPAPALTR